MTMNEIKRGNSLIISFHPWHPRFAIPIPEIFSVALSNQAVLFSEQAVLEERHHNCGFFYDAGLPLNHG